jgi:hypothetical protein
MGSLDGLFGLRRLLVNGAPLLDANGVELFRGVWNLLGAWSVTEGVDADNKPTLEIRPHIERHDVTYYGASPNKSATANDNAFVAAVAAAATRGGVVWIPAGRYSKLAQLNVPSGVTLQGEGDASILDYSGVAVTRIAIAATGSQGAGVALAADAAEGSDDLNVSGTGFAGEDWVKVYSTAVTGSTNLPKGEICRISDPATMTLYDPLCDSYATATTASVAKLTFVEGVAFRNFKILGPSDNAVTFSGILCDVTNGAAIENVTCERCHFYGVALQDSINWSVTGCRFSRSESGALAYGVAILNASQDGTISGCRGWRLRHLVTHGGFSTRAGVPRRTTTTCCVASQCRNSGFDAHAGGEDLTFSACHVLGSDSDGFTIECASASLLGCSVRDSLGPAFHLHPLSLRPFNVTLDGCRVSGKGYTASRSAVQIQVVTGYDLFDAVTINGGTFIDSRYGVRVLNAETGRLSNLTISGATWVRCGLDGDAVLQVTHAKGVSITGNTIYDSTNSVDAISLLDVEDFAVQGNVIRLPGTGGCRGVRCLTTCTDGVIAGNEVSAGASGIGIGFADTCTNITVGVNHLRGCPSPLALGTGTGHKLAQLNEISADRGNADTTLLHYSEQTQLHNTALTVARAVTLPGANVKARFRIVRGGSATGAFNLNVGTGPLKALTAAGQWCDVESDGTAYRLVASGSL